MVNKIYQIPFPPSNNTYYRHVGSRVLLSKKGREYKLRVKSAIFKAGRNALSGPLGIRMQLEPPDRRMRDLDNWFKAVFDAIEYSRLLVNDSQIKEIRAWWGRPIKGGLCRFMLVDYVEGFLWK